MKILGFIPARSGSKELKNKNLKKFNGKPLIYHTISISKKFKTITTFVSTDSKKILNLAKNYGVKFNYLRPKKMASDNSQVIDSVFHALKWFENNNIFFDAVMLLQPTSPIRIKKVVNEIIKIFKKKRLYSIASAVEFKDMNDTLKLHKSDWKFILKKRKISSNRQSLKNNFFTIDGSIYLAKVSFLKRYKSFVKENLTKIFVSSISPMIDINNIIDFKIAEFLKRKIYKTN